MLELMYDLPLSCPNDGAKYVVDAAAIETCKQLADLRVPQKESA